MLPEDYRLKIIMTELGPALRPQRNGKGPGNIKFSRTQCFPPVEGSVGVGSRYVDVRRNQYAGSKWRVGERVEFRTSIEPERAAAQKEERYVASDPGADFHQMIEW